MKVLITGSHGFIGKNLVAFLKERPEIEIVEFNSNDDFSELEEKISNIDFIYHLAGSNRPLNTDDFYKINTNFSRKLVTLLKEKNLKIPLVYSSSIQAENNSDYGKSKKDAEIELADYANQAEVFIFRLDNVFGKWCKPNYNSVIATFCYNLANDIPIKINEPGRLLNLIYIDDVIKHFLFALDKKAAQLLKRDNYYYVEPMYQKSVQEIADLITSFANSMKSLDLPQTGDDFIKKLFSTYVSYVAIDKMNFDIEQHSDERGSFFELSHTKCSGQFSISTTNPGVIRGNHYHHTKMEKFAVIKGKAKISFRKINETEIYDYYVNENKIKIITIPPGYTHKIENVGESEMILFIWGNEIFNSNDDDTHPCEV